MKYDWDKNKAEANIKSHNVSFEEAVLVFTDGWAIQEYDDAHSDIAEKRFTIIGLAETRLLRVTYTVENDEIIRIISAGEAEGVEIKDYEYSRNKFDW
ncbi:MAG: BrnT family toxin [Aridibacter sp.]